MGVLLVPDEQSLEDGVVTSTVNFDGIVRERRGAVDIQRRRWSEIRCLEAFLFVTCWVMKWFLYIPDSEDQRLASTDSVVNLRELRIRSKDRMSETTWEWTSCVGTIESSSSGKVGADQREAVPGRVEPPEPLE